MAVSEEKVLANAEVAARRFAPLGLEILQIDHGWQRGDVTGDWVPNERFPHGLRWLADELRKRYGLRLGLWIAPTDVAETSDLFREHRDWMLCGEDGKPRVNWRWYWKPNPDCYELDATHPEAYRWIEETFRTLRAVKGETAATFTLEFLGGTLGDQTLEVVGAPRWVVGDRDVLFVAPGRSRLSPLVRMMHGRVRVMVDAAGVETVAFHNGDPIPDPGAFGAARPQRRSRAGRPMSLAVFLAAVEARLRARGGA